MAGPELGVSFVMERLLVLALLMGMTAGVRADATIGTRDGSVLRVDHT